jgi:ligand-binding sensor domain-containing protein
VLLSRCPVRQRLCGAQNESTWRALGTWRQTQGLPQNSVRTILQTHDGYLWIGTNGGLARFDGVRFTIFDNSNQNQLRDNEIWALRKATIPVCGLALMEED